MVNPILQTLQAQGTTQQTNLNQVQQLINNFKNSSNPQQMVMNMLQSNPRLLEAVNQAKSNQSYKDLFYSVARAKGVDPDLVINLLKRSLS